MKVQPPRNYPGAQDRSLFEFQRWIIAVSMALGTDPPASLEELAEQSMLPVLSQIKEANRRIEEMDRQLKFSKNEINELKRKIDDLERSI